jgi:hypothetical protein
VSNTELSKQQAALDRKLCQRSLYYLCKEVLGYKDMVPHVHGHLCSFTTDKQYGRFRQATVPRSWFKTWVLTVGKAIWLTLPDEDGLFKDIYPYKGCNVRILIASNVIDNAAKMVFKIKQEWMHNERLQTAFPELVPDFNKTRWSDHVAEVVRTINATEGTYTAVGVGGSVISQHFDHILEDDLVYARKDDFTGQELMPSQEDIDNAIGWHKLSFSLLANPKTGCIDNTGTRWAPQDMINYIRKFEKQYACMELACTKDAQWPVVDDSQCIWPERYDVKTLETICHAQGMRIFETQYLNRPRATEDIVFKKEDVVIHSSLEEYPSNLEYSSIVDLAGWGDSKGTARNVVLTGAVDEKNHVWISRLDVRRMNPTEVIDVFKSHSRTFKSRIWIEEIQYQRAIRHFSRQEMERTGESFIQERLPYDGRKDAKNLRIRALEPIVSNGFLHILSTMSTLLEELEFYPHSKTVDILDCLGYLIRVAKKPISAPVNTYVNPFSMGEIEKELKKRGSGITNLPFDVQLSQWKPEHGRN